MATGQSNSNLVVYALVLVAAAVFFWLWTRRDESSTPSAEKTLENAEKTLRNTARVLKVPIQSDDDETSEAEREVMVKTAPPAMEPVPVDTLPPGIEPPTPPSIQPPTAPEIQPPSPPIIEPPSPPSPEPPTPPDIRPPVPPTIEPPEPPQIDPPAPPIIEPPTPSGVVVDIGDVPGDDDLTRIEGVGPRYRDILVAAGVKTFADLAGTTEDRLVELIRAAGARKPASIGTWARQADMAAKGDWEKLDAYQKTLTAGRGKKVE